MGGRLHVGGFDEEKLAVNGGLLSVHTCFLNQPAAVERAGVLSSSSTLQLFYSSIRFPYDYDYWRLASHRQTLSFGFDGSP